MSSAPALPALVAVSGRGAGGGSRGTPLIKSRQKEEFRGWGLGDDHECNTRGYAFVPSLQPRCGGLCVISGRTMDCQTVAASTKRP